MVRPLTRAEAAPRWAALLEGSPYRTPFARPAYTQALADALGYTLEPMGLFEDQTLLAGAQCFTRRVGPYRMATVPPLTAFTPVLLSAQADPATAETFLAHLKQRYGLVHLHLHPAMHGQVQAPGWTPRTLYTYWIDVQAGDRVGRWSASARRLFRKHETRYTVQESPAHIPALVAHCRSSYARHGRKLPVPAPRLLGLVERLHAQDLVRVFAATLHGTDTPEATLGLLHDGHTACYWLAGSTPGPAMTVLLGHLWQQLQTEGYQRFDFVGANTPTIAEFKRRFGGTRVPYLRLTHARHTAARWWAAGLRFR